MPFHIVLETLFTRIYLTMVLLACGLGLIILCGGETRFSGISYVGARHLVEWVGIPPWITWGSGFFAYGIILLMCMGRPLVAIHALRAGMILYAYFVLSLFVSIYKEPLAGLTGVIAYGIFFALHALLSDHLSEFGWPDRGHARP